MPEEIKHPTTESEAVALHRPCSALDAAWKSINPILRGAMDYADFKTGWEAAMKSIWDRLPMPAFGVDPMTPREVSKLLEYVRVNLPNAKDQMAASHQPPTRDK